MIKQYQWLLKDGGWGGGGGVVGCIVALEDLLSAVKILVQCKIPRIASVP